MWWDEIKTPSYVIDEERLVANLEILHDLEQTTGAHVLLSQKAFSAWSLYPLIGRYISGTSSSGVYEARLASEYMNGQNHVFSCAYKDADINVLARLCDHIIFNSVAQYRRYKDVVKRRSGNTCSIGLRINPEYSTQERPIYDPCAPGSRLGVTYDVFMREFEECMDSNGVVHLPDDIEGLHFHTMCEQGADALVSTWLAFEERFAPYLRQVKWVNLGGGQHITKEGYDIASLKELIASIRKLYRIEVFLEPGEAVALNAGYLVCEVCDIVQNGDCNTLVLDTSAACHMPDVLEMPYRPPLSGAYPANEMPYTYRLSSTSCLAGDIIGDYSFDHEVAVGERLVFEDMAIYTMVKNNTFNGMPLPSIALLQKDGQINMIKEFGYDEFKRRLS